MFKVDEQPIRPADIEQFRDSVRQRSFELLIRNINKQLTADTSVVRLLAGDTVYIRERVHLEVWWSFHAEVVQLFREAGWVVEKSNLEEDMAVYHFSIPKELVK